MSALRRLARVAQILPIALLFAGSQAHAERLEIPLPELLGEWDAGYGSADQTIEFSLPSLPAKVDWVELRLKGSGFPGAMTCYEWDEELQADLPHSVRVPTYFSAYIPEAPYRGWTAHSGPNPIGVFDQTFRFFESRSAERGITWDLLRDGRAELTLYLDSDWMPCEELTPSSRMKIEQAVLIVEGKFPKPGD